MPHYCASTRWRRLPGRSEVPGRAAACAALLGAALSGCGRPAPADVAIRVPDGFEVEVVADSLGHIRHLAVDGEGDVYVKMRGGPGPSVVALRDTTGDGRADLVERFGVFDDEPGGYQTETRIRGDTLYVSTRLGVYRYRLEPGRLAPAGPPDTLVLNAPDHPVHEHRAIPLAFDDDGNMYAAFGGPSNACERPVRTPHTPGLDPCPELSDHAGIWRFDAEAADHSRVGVPPFATGLRSVVGLAWDPVDSALFAIVHGRDALHRAWPELYSPWQNAVLPADELVRITEGSDFGWPYCYYDPFRNERVLAPEYGGDGESVDRCDAFDPPVVAFPAHFAPDDLLFYRDDQFPDRYRNGAFIAFHGSTNRSPYPQAGYFVGFVPFRDGAPAGDWEVFANGFAGGGRLRSARDARHRPVGLATGPDGSLYVADSVRGTVWRIRFTGDREAFGPTQLAGMAAEKQTAANIRMPDSIADDLEGGR